MLMSDLAGLPCRGVLGVVDSTRPMPAQGPLYVCLQQTDDAVLIRNPSTRLFDQYSRARKRTMAAAAGKRAASRQPADERGGKRQQQCPPPEGGLAAALQQLQHGKQQAAQPQAANARAAAPQAQAAVELAQQRHQGGVHAASPPSATATAAGAGAGAAAGQAPARVLTVQPNGANGRPHAAVPQTGGGGGVGKQQQLLCYTADELMAKPNKELMELLKSHHCRVTGKKEELVRRLLEYQRRVKKASSGSSLQPGAAVACGAATAGR